MLKCFGITKNNIIFVSNNVGWVAGGAIQVTASQGSQHFNF